MENISPKLVVKKIQTVIEFLNCAHLPVPGLSFGEWLNLIIKPSLIDLNLSEKQAEIILKLIINNKDLIIMQQNLPEC